MKKKLVAFMLVISMLAVAVVGGTLAYFTDEDYAENVMVMGSVEIDQHEKELDEQGNLVDFTQNKPVVPGVGAPKWGETITVGGGRQKLMDVKNVIDKFVYVENTGTSNAYVRTIVALEAPGFDAKDLIHINHNESEGVTISAPKTAVIDGVDYVYFVYTYTEELAPGALTPVSLAQVYLDPATTQEDAAEYGDTWEIHCLSQAVQADGFDDAATALNTAFGEATAANVQAWILANLPQA